MAMALARGFRLFPVIAEPVFAFTRNYGSKRAAKGLYGGKDIGFGNNVSHSERKTRRSWKPNVHNKRLWSETLQEFIQFKVTTYALKCVDKAGGLDNYLLNTHPAKLSSTTGEAAKVKILNKLEEMKISQVLV
jgi:large subunit ribosomal protein L28